MRIRHSSEASMRRILLLLCLVLPLGAARADALTVRDIIELSKSGVGEDVLLALVEVDHGIFPNDVATIKALKEAGVSEKVISAMVRKGRMPVVQEPPPPVQAPEPEPQMAPPPIVIEHHDVQPAVMVPYTVYPYSVFTTGGRHVRRDVSTIPATAPSTLLLSGAPIVPTGAPIIPLGARVAVPPCSDANPWYRVGSLCR
jgi:hypothetical protein